MPTLHRRQFGRGVLVLAALGRSFSASARAPSTDFKRLAWADLIPANWAPKRYFHSFDRDAVRDWEEDDPRARKLLRQLKALSRRAPLVAALEGQRVEIAGYPVLYGDDRLLLNQCFLSPYLGACVHKPPPPGNQLLHVRLTKPIALTHAAFPHWMKGTLRLLDTEHPYAMARYALVNAEYEPFDRAKDAAWLPPYPHV